MAPPLNSCLPYGDYRLSVGTELVLFQLFSCSPVSAAAMQRKSPLPPHLAVTELTVSSLFCCKMKLWLEVENWSFIPFFVHLSHCMKCASLNLIIRQQQVLWHLYHLSAALSTWEVPRWYPCKRGYFSLLSDPPMWTVGQNKCRAWTHHIASRKLPENMQNFPEGKEKISLHLTQPWESVTFIITCLVRIQDHAGICHCQQALEHLLQLQQHQNE